MFRLERPIPRSQLRLFDFPQNAWGGENVFLYLLTRVLGFAAANPCFTLEVNHIHCELPTKFGPQAWGDIRMSKK